MLRNIIKSLIPDKGIIFFNLFVQASDDLYGACNLLFKGVSVKNTNMINVSSKLFSYRKNIISINKDIVNNLERQCITPIDKGDIFYLSIMFLKLINYIVRINDKFQIFSKETNINTSYNSLIVNKIQLLNNVIQSLYNLSIALKDKQDYQIKIEYQKIIELDKSYIECFNDTIYKVYAKKYNTFNILVLKELYIFIEFTIEYAINLCYSIVCVYMKEI